MASFPGSLPESSSRAELVEIPTFYDDRGSLSVVEAGMRGVAQFPIRRIFWIHEATQPRGGHLNSGPYLMVAVSGTVRVRIYPEKGRMEYETILKDPEIGLSVPRRRRVKMDKWSDDAVMLVVSPIRYVDEKRRNSERK